MKRIISIILAIIMTMSFWTPTFAVEEDSTPGELCETFLLYDYHFDPSHINKKMVDAIIEGDAFTVSGSYVHENGYALLGGGQVTVITIAPNAGQNVKITRVEARLFRMRLWESSVLQVPQMKAAKKKSSFKWDYQIDDSIFCYL